MIGTFERNIGGNFIYRTDAEYIVMDPQRFFAERNNAVTDRIPRSVNIWQAARDIRIWLLARSCPPTERDRE